MRPAREIPQKATAHGTRVSRAAKAAAGDNFPMTAQMAPDPSDPRLALIPECYRRLTGSLLVPEGSALADALWNAPRVIVAHGTEADPVFFYGNRLALELFETDFAAFTAMPSRLSAEPVARVERERLLARVLARGYIDDYAGIRISAKGNRFRIEQATVWNLVDGEGRRHGQAATFAHWQPL
jgi:hypothetical protein